VSHILEFAKQFFAQSPWREHVELSEDGVMGALAALRENPNAYLEINEHGAIAGMLTPLWFAPDVVIASELFWYSQKPGEGKALRERFEAWAKERGARFSHFSGMVNENEDRLRRTLRSQGYNDMEIGFIKEI